VQTVYQEVPNDVNTRLVVKHAERSHIILETKALEPAFAWLPAPQQGETGMPIYGWRVVAVIFGALVAINGPIFIWVFFW
jgi:hypothetical protein